MKDDQNKSKAQLIKELDHMRLKSESLESRIAELFSILNKTTTTDAPRAPRVTFNSNIEFIGNFDILQAEGINLSNEGLCFELEEALPFEMRFDFENELQKKSAQLVWVKRTQSGKYRCGLKFD